MGNWPVATWCFCLALPLIISNVELCKLRSRLAVSGNTSSTPTPTTPPSSASQPASSTPSPVHNSCLVSLSGPAVAAAAFPVSHLCCVSQMWPGHGSAMCPWRFPATFTLCQACGRCWRPSWPVSSSRSSATPPCPCTSRPWSGRYSICFFPAAVARLLKLDDWEDIYSPLPTFQAVDPALSFSTLASHPLAALSVQ